MSRSLLEDAEQPDENLNFHLVDAGDKEQLGQSRQQSRAHSEVGVSIQHSDVDPTRLRGSEAGSVSRRTRRQPSRAQSESDTVNHSDMEQPRGRKIESGSIGRFPRKQRSQVPSETGESAQVSDVEQPRVRGSEIGSVGRPGSALSEAALAREEKLYRASKNTSRAASTAGSVKFNNARTKSPSVLNEDAKPTNNISISSRPSYQNNSIEEEAASSTPPVHPGGCAATKIGRLLLSKYTIPAVLWLAFQVLAIILISLLADIVTYKSLIQVSNIDSMVSHIGMYTSVVNSYLTTHAQSVSQSAQETMLHEFNLHLHHIARVKAIFENDLVRHLSVYSFCQQSTQP